MLLLELLLLGLLGHSLLFVLHYVSLVDQEVGWVHDLLVDHVLLLETHLLGDLPLSLICQPSRVLRNLWLEAQLAFFFLLLNGLLEFELLLVELQSVQVVHVEHALDLLYF